jgi:ComF family protein
MKLIDSALDFFLPRFCSSCKSKLPSEEKFICVNCLSNIQQASAERLKNEYDKKFNQEQFISGFTSLFVFEKEKELQSVIHDLKYNGKYRLGIFLGKLFANNMYDRLTEWKIDLIIPVPLHHVKRAERGYNQSDYIVKGISSNAKIRYHLKLIKRKRFTETQTELNLMQRKQNVSGAFKLKSKLQLTGKNILLIDDVITTGATISECGKILHNAGANRIYAGSIAIAD